MNRLILGDCVEKLKEIEKKSVDLVVTSPPYDDMRCYDDYKGFDLDGVVSELYRVLKDGGVVVWIVGDSFRDGSETCTSFKQALRFREEGFNLLDTMIWDKNSFAFPCMYSYHQVFEYMFVFCKGKPKTANFIKDRVNLYIGSRGKSGRDKGGERLTGKGVPPENVGKRFNIWKVPIGGGNTSQDELAFEHPAIFPEVLAADHIRTWSNEGDVVLDPFMGSATTGVACAKLNRDFIGIEISEKYFDLCQRRMKKIEFERENSLF